MLKVKISNRGYDNKPDIEELKFISWDFKNSNRNTIVTYKSLSEYLKNGHSVLLADYEGDCMSVNEEFINSLSCIALDIDSKDNKTTLYEMVTIIYQKLGVYPVIDYCTFSDTDNSKFRLIYRLEDKIDVETYRTLYKALQWKFKQLDKATCNANRIWAGTNKSVNYRENDIPFTFEKVVKLVRAYENKVKRDTMKKTIVTKEGFKEVAAADYIKTEFKKDVMEYLISNIDLREFIPKHFGGKFKRNGDNITGSCIFHGGDNKNALVISKAIYTCFTHCGTGNIITAARKAYREDNFSKVAFRLAKEYNLYIPNEYIKVVN